MKTETNIIFREKILDNATLFRGNNIDALYNIPSNSIDSVVTDPPYGLSFLNKKWDYDVPSVQVWKEIYRVLKPGGHILSFGGTRTYHRMVVNIEDAGFEIRDQIQWIYGTGFPKSMDIGKLDAQFHGLGTSLKPANEPICLARKPIDEINIINNIKKYGTGGINIDECKIHSNPCIEKKVTDNERRFPTNVIFDEITSQLLGEKSKFFYVPKVSKQERNFGLSGMKKGHISHDGRKSFIENPFQRHLNVQENTHPTVKPIELMKYLVRLVTPKGGIILDPFMGSGSTGIASLMENYKFIGMELDCDYFNIAKHRISNYKGLQNSFKIKSVRIKDSNQIWKNVTSDNKIKINQSLEWHSPSPHRNGTGNNTCPSGLYRSQIQTELGSTSCSLMIL